jgi:hypothetical protein
MLSLFALIGGLLGAVAQPLLGLAYDQISFGGFLALINLALLCFLIAMAVSSSFAVQVISLVVGTFQQYAWGSLVLCWGLFFAPPELNGTSMGVLFSAGGLLQIGAVAMTDAVASAMHAESDTDRLLWPLLLYGGIALGFGVAANAAICWKGLPTAFKRDRNKAPLVLLDDPLGLQVDHRRGQEHASMPIRSSEGW